MEAKVVIGAGFGDEGKGLMTDFYASKDGEDCLVIRHNGGAQAGHTVNTPGNQRHVFSHIGSGSFVGAKTWLSNYFVINPIIFAKEAAELATKVSFIPKQMVSPDCLVTTPYDMMINEFIEEARGSNRHGSVGVGFGETIERSLVKRYRITVQTLSTPKMLEKKLEYIRTEWVLYRLTKLGFGELFEKYKDIFLSDDLKNRWVNDAITFRGNVDVVARPDVSKFKSVVFEGAQGLMLDQDMGWFPHVTRSNTGIKNACEIAEYLGLQKLDVTYMTRCYATRHGAGPLFGELKDIPYAGIREKTNVTHKFQGHFRYAYLNLDLLSEFIFKDLKNKSSSIDLTAKIGVTCLDQAGENITWFENGDTETGSHEALIESVKNTTRIGSIITSYGETRNTIF